MSESAEQRALFEWAAWSAGRLLWGIWGRAVVFWQGRLIRMGSRVLAVMAMAAIFCLCSPVQAVEVDQYQMAVIQAECEKYGLSSALAYGVIMAESGFDVKADSGSSKGVMQLNKNTYPKLAKELGIADFNVFDYEENVAVGVYYLASLRDYWAEQERMDEDVVALMLISYNRGLAGCRRYVAEYGLENHYVNKVLGYKWALERGVM